MSSPESETGPGPSDEARGQGFRAPGNNDRRRGGDHRASDNSREDRDYRGDRADRGPGDEYRAGGDDHRSPGDGRPIGRDLPPRGFRPVSDGHRPAGNGYHPAGNGFRSQDNGYLPQENGYGPPANGYGAPPPGAGDHRQASNDDEATREYPATGDYRPGGSDQRAAEPGPDYRAGGNDDGAPQRRRAGGRTPGAHRASKADGLIPGFGRSRPRPDYISRHDRGGGPGPDGAPRHSEQQGPWPADVPSPGEAGLAGEGYGVSPEGELTDAELERSWYRPAPGSSPAGPRPAEPTQPRRAQERPAEPGDGATPSLVRSSGVMALGTLASRVTGLVRSVVLVYALGLKGLANAYNYANTLPNTVYNLAIGGILTSVIVPLLVSAARRHRDKGEQYDQRMFTLVTGALAGITLVATLAAAPIASLYDPKATGAEHHLLVIFAYFFIPQIFFYGVSSLAGAILNARGHFAAPMWTPVVNNLVVTVIAIAFMAVAAGQDVNKVSTISNGEVLLLGIGTTLGIVAQTAALVPALRRVGFRWRPRFDFRRVEINEIGRMAGWMFGYVLTTQVAFLVTSIVASTAGNAKQTGGVGAGFSAYSNAWLLFQLPYAIVAISVITALLPRMSGHAADRRFDLVQSDFSTGVRLGSVVVAPAALVLAALGPPLAEVLLGWGNTSDASARYLGLVFSIFSLGLVPYMLFQLLLRVFYALHDSKTPALIGVATMVTNAGANLIALAVFPKSEVVAALGAGFGLANVVGTVLAWRVLSRRLGGLAGHQIGRSLARMHAAAVPAAVFALVVAVLIGSVFSTAKSFSALVVVVGGAGALLIYVVAARKLRVTEVTDLMGVVRSRLHR